MSHDDLQTRIQKQLGEKFRSISVTRLERLGLGVMSLEAGAADEAVVDEVMREIHTLKGEANLVGMEEINALSHSLEDLLHAAQTIGWRKVDPELWDLLLFGLDAISQNLQDKPPDFGPEQYRRRVDRWIQKPTDEKTAAEAETLSTDTENPPEPSHEPDSFGDESGSANENGSPTGTEPIAPAERPIFLESAILERQTAILSRLSQNHASTRIAATQVGVAISRSFETLRTLRRSEPVDELEKLETVINDLATVSSRLSELSELRFERSLSLEQMEEILRELRMVPLSVLFGPLPRVVRGLGRDLHKNAGIEIEGGEIPVDQKAHAHLQGPLLHLLRNAVDHGIESSAERLAAGKPANGLIRVSADRRGAFVMLTVADDGRGIDTAMVAKKAIDQGVIDADSQSRGSDRQDLLDLVFHPGFSTRDQVTEVSGRGVGLDAVRHAVEGLGGSVRVFSQAGQGTTFRLVIPASSTFQSLLLIQVGDDVIYGLPAAIVKRVLSLSSDLLKEAGGGTVFDLEHELLPLFDLHAVIHQTPPAEDQDGQHRIVVIDHGDRRVGFEVSRVLGEESLLCRDLDPFFEHQVLVAGTSVRGGRSTVLVLNPAELMHALQLGERRRSAANPEPKPQGQAHRRSIMVVDDSDLTRTIISELLRDYDHRVLEARHGKEALQILEQETIDLMLVDLDMPVMSGFELLEARRQLPALADIPALIFSSRDSPEDKRRCLELGAKAYIIKSDFAEDKFYRAISLHLP